MSKLEDRGIWANNEESVLKNSFREDETQQQTKEEKKPCMAAASRSH
jgi:hypothetical protein